MDADSEKASYILRTYLLYSLEVIFRDKTARDRLSESQKELVPHDRKAIIFEECPLHAVSGLRPDFYNKEGRKGYFIEASPLLVADRIYHSELEHMIEDRRTKDNSLVIVVAQGKYDDLDEAYYRVNVSEALRFGAGILKSD